MVAFGIGILLYGSKPVRPQGAQRQPLSLSQIERLIQVQAPDATISAEIRQRGLNFAPGKETADTLRRLGAGPETLQAVDELRPMLDDAKQAIPALLTKIYQALDQGNLQAIRSFVSPQIVGDSARLDAICRPFTYKAHYIEAIIERPGQKFEVRVHAFFQPFHENVYVLTFHPFQGNFLLSEMSDPTDDWFGPAKEAAILLARNFIYAAKAQRADVLAGLVAPGLDVSRYTDNSCWHELFQQVAEVNGAHAELESHEGVKVVVHATVSNTNEQSIFWVDRVNDQYKIVSADPLHGPSFILNPLFNNAPAACRGLDPSVFAPALAPHLEEDTLKRFGLPLSSTQPGGVYRVGGNVTKPVPTYKPEPPYTPEARQRKIKGEVGLQFVVDANGNVGDVKVVKSLEPSLDDSAVRTVRTWKFQPGTRDGVPVAVQVGVEISFRMF
jgi:TonB family protein